MQDINIKDEDRKPDYDSAPKRKRSYYYDDAHGYEEYDPKEDAEDKDEDDEIED